MGWVRVYAIASINTTLPPPPKTARRQRFPQGCLAENNKILRIPPPCVMAVASQFRAGTTLSSLTAVPSTGFPVAFQDAPLEPSEQRRLRCQTRVYTLTGPPAVDGRQMKLTLEKFEGRGGWRGSSSCFGSLELWRTANLCANCFVLEDSQNKFKPNPQPLNKIVVALFFLLFSRRTVRRTPDFQRSPEKFGPL